MPATKISAMPSVSSLLGSEVFPVVQLGTNKKSTILDIVNYFPLSGIGSTGLLTSTDWNTFNNKQSSLTIGNLSETGSSILTITGGTGAIIGSGLTIQVKQATTSQNGFLSSTDWNTFNSKGNGTVTSVDLITGTTGTDVNVSGSPITSSGSITLNIPDASATARGLITTGTQTLAGSKTFSSAPTFSTMTPGSVLFAGTSGLLSQDNTNLFWDDTNNRLGIGTNAPSQTLRVVGDTSFSRTITTASGTGGVSSFQTIISPTTNSTGSHRGFFIANNHSAAGINFTGSNTAAGWFENRPFDAGTIQQLNGFITSGLVLASNTISCGTVSEVIAGRFLAVNQFSNTLTTTITTSIALLVDNNIKTNATITNSIGAVFNGMTTGTNNTDLLIGSSTPGTGNWSIYGASSNNNYINGKLFIGTTTDAGFKLDVNGTARIQDNLTISDAKNIILGTTTGTKIGTATSQKIGFWNTAPIVQPTTAVGSATVASPGAGSTIKTDDTFDGYTLQQVVKALRNIGILA